jgi:23S rRNA (guanosine2251-2'-O)-methyltransferase
MMYEEKKQQNQMVFGIRAVMEAIEAGKEIESLFVQKGLGGGLFRELQAQLSTQTIKAQYVPVEKLNRLTPKNHQGVVAFISPIIYQRIEDIIPGIYEKGEVPLVLVLDRVTDVRNFGAIVRTAECSGVHAIVVPLKGSAQVNADAVKTSAGALYNVPVCREHNLKHTLGFLKDSGLQIVSCTEKNDQTLYDVDFTSPTAIIMGSEEDGISGEYLKFSDHYAMIPMMGTIESLNVSVSAGVILYEAVRQRIR